MRMQLRNAGRYYQLTEALATCDVRATLTAAAKALLATDAILPLPLHVGAV